jgi:hypothetical protein
MGRSRWKRFLAVGRREGEAGKNQADGVGKEILW